MPEPGGLTFVDYLRPVWRFKWIVLLVIVVAGAATYLVASRKTKVYQTSTQLYIGQSSLQALLSPTAAPPSQVAVANQALLLTTPGVADAVRKRLNNGESASSLLNAISVTPSTTTDFLTITAQSTNPVRASQIANGFAQGYLDVAGGSLVSSAEKSLKATQARLKDLARGLSNATVRTGLRQEIATLEGIISSPPSVGQQLKPAPVSNIPVSPKPSRDAIFAAVIAFALAVIFSYLFDRGDRRVRELDQLESLFDLPVLANLPHVRHAEDPAGVPTRLLEPLRSLRVGLDLARASTGKTDGQASANGSKHDSRAILISSALPSEGKSTVVRNLAMSYREAGMGVAVLEADLRRPVLADRFGVAQEPGLANALATDEDLWMQRVSVGGDESSARGGSIDIAVAGAAGVDPTALLIEERLHAIISRVSAEYDIVLIDSPPLLAVSDAIPLLTLVDGVVLVVRAGTVTRPAAARVRTTIERVGQATPVHMLGIVANDVADELAAYYGDYRGAPAASSGKRPSGLAAS